MTKYFHDTKNSACYIFKLFLTFSKLEPQYSYKLYSYKNEIVLSSYEITTENYFCVCHKNKWKHNQYFKLIFFQVNLHFGTSNWILHTEN